MADNKDMIGQWIVDGSFIRTSDGKSIALVNTDREEWQDNAYLIAAALDLLDAATWLVYLMHDIGKNGGPPSDDEYKKAGDFAKAAIDKATKEAS